MKYNIYEVIANLDNGKMILAEIGAQSFEKAANYMKEHIDNLNLKFTDLGVTSTKSSSDKEGILELIID